jgi:hypothetical protein
MNAETQAAFARSMVEIRERVRLERTGRIERPIKRRASVRRRIAPVKKTPVIRAIADDHQRFARFKAGRSRYFTNSSYATDLRNWWTSQDRFVRQLDFAAFLGVESETVSSWFGSRKFPQEKMCDTLFSSTNLACFSPPKRHEARREHNLNRAKLGLRRCNDAAKLFNEHGKILSGIGRACGR